MAAPLVAVPPEACAPPLPPLSPSVPQATLRYDASTLCVTDVAAIPTANTATMTEAIITDVFLFMFRR